MGSIKARAARGALLAAVLLAAGGSSAVAQSVTLKVSSFSPPSSSSTMRLSEWIEAITRDSGGEVTGQGYWGGAIGRGPVPQLKLMMDGVSDVAFVNPAYTHGKFPDLSLLNLPYLVEDGREGALVFWRLYEQGLMRGFDDFKPLALFTTEISGLHTTKPVRRLEDIKGLKIRTTGAGEVKMVQLLGAASVAIPVTGVAEAVSRNTVDGVVLEWLGLVTFKIDRVTSYHVDHRDANFGVIPLMFAMNKDAYARLSPRARQAIDKNSGERFSYRTSDEMENLGDRLIAEHAKDPAHTIIRLDPAEKERWRAALMPMHADWIKENAEGRKRYDAAQKILSAIRSKK